MIVKSQRIIEEYHFLAFQERFVSVPEKYFWAFSFKCLERKCRKNSKIKVGRFYLGRSTTYQIFTLRQVFKKSWEYAKHVSACFVNQEKAYDRVPQDQFWRVQQKYGIDRHLSTAIKSLYCQSEIYVCLNVNNQLHFMRVLVFGKNVFCHLSFSSFTRTGWTSSAEPISVSLSEDATLVGCFSQTN